MRDGMARAGAIVISLAAGLSGCTGPGGGSPHASPASTGAGSGSGSPPTSVGAAIPADVLDPIVADAATRGGVDAGSITVVAASAETWPNGALGCPDPGAFYTQAIVHGWKVIVEASGTRLDYRSSGPGRFKLCSQS